MSADRLDLFSPADMCRNTRFETTPEYTTDFGFAATYSRTVGTNIGCLTVLVIFCCMNRIMWLLDFARDSMSVSNGIYWIEQKRETLKRRLFASWSAVL